METGKKFIEQLIIFLMLTGWQSTNAVAATSNGNQLNPESQPPSTIPDPAGLNTYQMDMRTPSGLLYLDVKKWPELKPVKGSDWQYNISAEAGYIGVSGDSKPASFIEYGDWSEGPILNRFMAILEKPGTAQYVNIYGGGVGRDDQYLKFSAGKYGKYDLTLGYDSIPHVFSTNAKVLWQGKGTNSLTLPQGLTPGGSTRNQVLAAFQSVNNSSISLERDKASISFSFKPNRGLNLFANGSIEWRDGARPFGGGFTYPGLGQVSETIEPVDYVTHDITVGLNFVNQKYQVNLSYAGSFFENNNQTLTWENPGLTSFLTLTPVRGRFALAPDNENHYLKGDFATSLPFWHSRITTSLSYNNSSQNDMLIPPTVSSGTSGNPTNPVNFDLWNSVNALSSERADAEIEALNLHTKLTMNPIRRLRLTGEFRFHDQDNKTDYTALNPLTGEYGYLAFDGGLDGLGASVSGIYDPARPGSRVRFRNIPFESDTILFNTGAEYSLTGGTHLAGNYEREEIQFSHREVEEVVDDRFQLRLTHRKSGLGTVRLSYEYSDRDSGPYNPNPYEPFYTSSLTGYIPRFPGDNVLHTLSAMRKYDIASRDSNTFNAKLNAIIGDKMDVMVTGSYIDEDYDAGFGLNNSESVTANVEWSYQFALNGSLYAYYSYQEDDRRLTNINDAGLNSYDADPGGPVYPLDRLWSETITETNHNIGAGLNYTHGRVTFDLTYSYLYSRSRFRYEYASSAAYFNLFSPGEVGSGFPDQVYKNHLLEGNLRWLIRDGTNLRLMYRYEKENLDDFHYTGLIQPVVGNNNFLLAVPRNYKAHVIAVTVETSF